MKALEIVRRAAQGEALRPLALRPETTSAYFAGQHRSLLAQNEMRAYPALPTVPIQVMNPSDPNFGKTYFLPGYDTPGDTRHPIYPGP